MLLSFFLCSTLFYLLWYWLIYIFVFFLSEYNLHLSRIFQFFWMAHVCAHTQHHTWSVNETLKMHNNTIEYWAYFHKLITKTYVCHMRIQSRSNIRRWMHLPLPRNYFERNKFNCSAHSLVRKKKVFGVWCATIIACLHKPIIIDISGATNQK